MNKRSHCITALVGCLPYRHMYSCRCSFCVLPPRWGRLNKLKKYFKRKCASLYKQFNLRQLSPSPLPSSCGSESAVATQSLPTDSSNFRQKQKATQLIPRDFEIVCGRREREREIERERMKEREKRNPQKTIESQQFLFLPPHPLPLPSQGCS